MAKLGVPIKLLLVLQQNLDTVLILLSFSASPGRLVDHLENTKGFNLRTLKYLVRCFPTFGKQNVLFTLSFLVSL